MAAALRIILVMTSQRLGARHTWYGLALRDRPLILLVLLVLLVLRMARDLQERA